MKIFQSAKLPFLVLGLFLVAVASGCASGPKPLTDADKKLVPSGTLAGGVRTIKVVAKKYEFIPNPIVVRQGEKVRLEVTSTDVEHGLAIPAYKLNQDLKPGKTEVMEFTASQSGSFATHCSEFCGMGHMGMSGELVVIPAGQ
jgi:cytochrome c oxidase subunit 2